MLFHLPRSHHAGAAVVRLSDSVLRADSIPRRLLRLAIGSGRRALHLDLGNVERPTASGLGQLVALRKELAAAGIALALLNVAASAGEVFAVTGLTEILDVRRA